MASAPPSCSRPPLWCPSPPSRWSSPSIRSARGSRAGGRDGDPSADHVVEALVDAAASDLEPEVRLGAQQRDGPDRGQEAPQLEAVHATQDVAVSQADLVEHAARPDRPDPEALTRDRGRARRGQQLIQARELALQILVLDREPVGADLADAL